MPSTRSGHDREENDSGTRSPEWSLISADLEEKILDVIGPIQEKSHYVRTQKHVNWFPYLDACFITEDDYSFLTAFQQTKTKEERDKLLGKFKDDAFKTLVTVLQRVCIVEEIQKFLVLIDDMLNEDPSRLFCFDPCKTEPWKAFLDLLSCGDSYVRTMSSRIISKFITQNSCRPKEPDLRFFLNWLKGELRPENEYLLSIIRCLQGLLRIDEYRLMFLSLNGIFRMIRLLSVEIKPQAQYQLIYCIWVSSFNSEIAEKLNKYSIVPVFMQVWESCPSEIVKLPRVIVASFRNLLEKPREPGVKKHNALLMIQCKISKSIEIIKVRMKVIDDPEFFADLEAVDKILAKYVAELSTFDEYQLEVKSGRLEWSVVHASKPFWKENAARLNNNKYELLKMLLSLLEVSDDSTVLCVAAHDLGEYMRYYPRGKRLVEDFGGKDALLELLSHKHPVVKYYALKSLQILMLSNYDLLIEYVSEPKSVDSLSRKNRNKEEKFWL